MKTIKTKRLQKILLSLFIAILLITTIGLKPQDKETPKKGRQITSITYNFYDASVPPPYHRSYEIILTKEAITLTVDSYGDILVQESFPQTEETLASFSDFIQRNKLKRRLFIKGDSGCTGGTGESIFVTYSDGSQFKGEVYYCGGKTRGSMKGDIENAVDEITGLIPDLGKYLE